jgi:hypothetical protein
MKAKDEDKILELDIGLGEIRENCIYLLSCSPVSLGIASHGSGDGRYTTEGRGGRVGVEGSGCEENRVPVHQCHHQQQNECTLHSAVK